MPRKEYYYKHKEELIKKVSEWKIKLREKDINEFNARNRKYSLKSHLKLKKMVFEKLGNRCSNPFNLPHPDWCNDSQCLQIDHIKGGGKKEIDSMCRHRMYKKILEHPEDYQLLCANCNWLKRKENINHEDGGRHRETNFGDRRTWGKSK